MDDKQGLKQKGFLATFSLSIFLWLSIPGFAADYNLETKPNPKQADNLELETFAFRLAPQPVFTLTNKTLYAPNPYFSSLQKNEEITPQILTGAPKSKRMESSLFAASLLTLTALNIADYVSTVKALQLPGLKEGNPIMRPFTKNILLFSAVKIGLTALDFYLLKNIYKKNKTLGWVLSIAGNFAMSYIVSNNIRKIQAVTRK